MNWRRAIHVLCNKTRHFNLHNVHTFISMRRALVAHTHNNSSEATALKELLANELTFGTDQLRKDENPLILQWKAEKTH